MWLLDLSGSVRAAAGAVFTALLCVVGWLVAVVALAGVTIPTCIERPWSNPLDNGAWLAVLFLELFTALFTWWLRLVLESRPRALVLSVVPAAVSLVVIIVLARVLPPKDVHADVIAVEFEAAVAALYLGAVVRLWLRERRRAAPPQAIARRRA